jgi:spermidine/putrescine transport system substrate-binding protein
MTGLGYDQAVTGPLANLDILFAPDYAGRLTFLTEMRDTVGLAAIRQGTDIATMTDEQYQAALADVKAAVDNGIVRQITGNSYVNDMQAGDVVLAMAWSGDVVGTLRPEQSEGQDFQWTLADQGGYLWTDNMVIPKGAVNKAQAQVFIDWYYVPANAAEIGAYVQYVIPVKGADEAIAAIDPALATNTFIFPDAEMTARLHLFRSLDPDTDARWTEDFNTVIGL